jgi:uncharacterized glyoxalase superfamily protein PhnB
MGTAGSFSRTSERPCAFYSDHLIVTVFHALAENGTVQMPLQKTFWSVRFGVLVDQFGIPWAINCEQAPSLA